MRMPRPCLDRACPDAHYLCGFGRRRFNWPEYFRRRLCLAKQVLRGMAYGQQQIEDCAAVVLVCGRLDAFEEAAVLYAQAAEEIRDKFVPMIGGVYRGQPALQREEAIRSGALAAMTLMYAARHFGWDSGPMIGFDAAKVSTLTELPATVVPVLMMTLGKALEGAIPARLYRRPVSEIVQFETFQGTALAD